MQSNYINKISVVIPIFNEKENLDLLANKTTQVLEQLNLPFEIILVNDGSTDGSKRVLDEISKKTSTISVIHFDRNYGQTSAFAAGFHLATGNVIVTMDGDLQNDPQDIAKLLSFIPEYDAVCGIRKKRNDKLVKKISAWIANTVRNLITHENITDTGCSLKAFKKECLDQIPLFEGLHRFFPTLVKMKGGSIKQIEVSHHQRLHGKSKYNISNRLFKSFLDCLAVRWMQKRNLNYRILKNE